MAVVTTGPHRPFPRPRQATCCIHGPSGGLLQPLERMVLAAAVAPEDREAAAGGRQQPVVLAWDDAWARATTASEGDIERGKKSILVFPKSTIKNTSEGHTMKHV